MDNCDLLAICDPHGIIKMDKDSELIWATDASRMMHHDLFVTDDGMIYVLGKRLGKRPEIDAENTLIQDLVIVLDADGNRLREFSILEAFLKSHFGDDLVELIRRGAKRKPRNPGCVPRSVDFRRSFRADELNSIFDQPIRSVPPCDA